MKWSETVIRGRIEHIVVDKGYFFISRGDGPDVFAFRTSLINRPFSEIYVGDRCEFETRWDEERSKLRATNVTVL